MAERWFPRERVSLETMAKALWLEEDYWEKFRRHVAAGVSLAFNGE